MIPSQRTTKISSHDKRSAIRIEGKLCNGNKLETMPNLKNLFIFNIKLNELLALSMQKLGLDVLYLYNAQIEDLSPLEQFKTVKYILINWNSKVSKLWKLTCNEKLEGLSLTHTTKIRSLRGLEKATNLKHLSLSGGMWSTLILDTLSPIASLKNLEYVSLKSIRVLNDGLKPLKELTKLKELDLSNQFETEDYALLSVFLKNTKCNLFSPYVKLSKAIAGKDVMITGKRKPFLNSKSDKERIAKYVTAFENYKEKYAK